MKRKHVTALFLAAVMALSMAGCGTKTVENKASEAQTEESKASSETEASLVSGSGEKVLVC
ncbi:MAG: ABC transporter substrate-binding protein, partial [Frisingicoccus sp.]|nr:ABC transporter substrate-binding protein [Frisingicoccus sp.]